MTDALHTPYPAYDSPGMDTLVRRQNRSMLDKLGPGLQLANAGTTARFHQGGMRMHRAISNAVRPGAFDRRPAWRVRLSAIPVGQPRILNDWLVFRFGADIFAIDGIEGQHDCISAASVISGAGNPLPDEN